MRFFYLVNSPKLFVIYVHVCKKSDIIFAIKHFFKIKKNQRTLNLIYSSDFKEDIIYENIDLKLYKSPVNFEPALLHHNYLKNRSINAAADVSEFLNIYNNLCNIVDSLDKKNIENVVKSIQTAKHKFAKKEVNYIDNLDFYLNLFTRYIQYNVVQNFNFKEVFFSYSVPYMHSSWFGDGVHYSTKVLENVYYTNKAFYNEDGSFADIDALKLDIEYQHYNNTKLSINIEAAVKIEEPVLFLDYIYDFYNFGEFWDVMQRILFADINEPVEVFGLNNHRVLNIATYFNKCKLTFPPKYSRKYNWEDIKQANQKELYFFKKLYISTINNTCRGALNPWFAFEMNKLYNNNQQVDKEYKLYLSRGSYKRGMVDEERLIKLLKNEGFIILNGQETFDEILNYFTNAKLILGIHSSLMKNMIWCKKNPIFIELFPPSRSHLCFIGNAEQLGFNAIPIPCTANEKEEILMTETQIKDLIKLIKIL